MRLFLGRALLAFSTVVLIAPVEAQARELTSELVLEDDSGHVIGTGEVHERTTASGFEIVTTYVFKRGTRVEERSSFVDAPQLEQRSWSWRELRGQTVLRAFDVDFRTGHATGMKQDTTRTRRWDEHLRIHPGRTFGGPGFAVALRALSPKWSPGATAKLEAVAFTPKPRVVSVVLRGGEATLLRDKSARHFVLHPSVGFLVRAVAHPPDYDLWLTTGRDPQLAAVRGLLLEPSDPTLLIRVVRFAQSGG